MYEKNVYIPLMKLKQPTVHRPRSVLTLCTLLFHLMLVRENRQKNLQQQEAIILIKCK